MNAFIKTLIGDGNTVSCVAVIVLAAFGLIATGEAAVAPYVIPPLALAAVGWLARR